MFWKNLINCLFGLVLMCVVFQSCQHVDNRQCIEERMNSKIESLDSSYTYLKLDNPSRIVYMLSRDYHKDSYYLYVYDAARDLTDSASIESNEWRDKLLPGNSDSVVYLESCGGSAGWVDIIEFNVNSMIQGNCIYEASHVNSIVPINRGFEIDLDSPWLCIDDDRYAHCNWKEKIDYEGNVTFRGDSILVYDD